MNVIQALAHRIVAKENCERGGMDVWKERHTNLIHRLVAHFLPSGSGFDCGTTLDWVRSTGDKLVFHTSFHHMNEAGMYCGWTEHSVVVSPSFDGVTVHVTGRNINDIKTYIGDTFYHALRQDVDGFINEQVAEWNSQDVEQATVRG